MLSPPVMSVTAETGIDAGDAGAGDVERALRSGHVGHEQVERQAGRGDSLNNDRAARPFRAVGSAALRSCRMVAGIAWKLPLACSIDARTNSSRSAESPRWVGISASITDTWLLRRPGSPLLRIDTGTATTTAPAAGRRGRASTGAVQRW